MDKFYCFACMQPIDAREAVCPHCGYDNHRRTNGLGYLPEYVLGKRYLVGRKLGMGGFGITYIGRDLMMDSRIAIKEYFPTALGRRGTDGSFNVYNDDESVKEFEYGKHRMLMEARAGFELNGIDNVVRIYNVIEVNNTVYIIMEYIEGETLRELVGECSDEDDSAELEKLRRESVGPMSFPEAAKLFKPIFQALKQIHAKKVIHGDACPANIMIRKQDGAPVLIDFGGVGNIDGSGDGPNIVRIGYSPTEMYTGRSKLDARSEEFTLASAIWFALTGMRPADARKRMMGQQLPPLAEARAKRANEFVQDARSRMQISKDQENVLLKAMSLKREDRYGSIAEFEEALFGDMGEKYYCFSCMNEIASPNAVCRCGHNNHNRKNPKGYLQECVLQEQYQVGRMLGKGGFGITYIGRDLKENRRIAIKEYFPTELGQRADDGSFDPYGENEAEFRRGKRLALKEAENGGKVADLDNVVRTYCSVEANNTVYIIMEYVEGETLKKHIGEMEQDEEEFGGQETRPVKGEGSGPMTFPEAMAFFTPVFQALSRIHAKGIIHSDISPDNIMIRGREPVLLDFGAARSVHRLGAGSASMSKSQNVWKPCYSPLEQRTQTERPDARSDEFALASTMWFALTGIQPEDAINRQIGHPLPSLAEARARRENVSVQKSWEHLHIAPVQEEALHKAMSLKREDRYDTVMEFLQALEGKSSKTVPKPSVQKPPVQRENDDAKTVINGSGDESGEKKKSFPLALAVLLLAAIVTAAALMIVKPWGKTAPEPEPTAIPESWTCASCGKRNDYINVVCWNCKKAKGTIPTPTPTPTPTVTPLVSFTPSPTPKPKDTPTPNTASASNSGSLDDGTYIGIGKGFSGDIKVEVTVSNGVIAKVDVVEQQEIAGMGLKAVETLPSEFAGISTSEGINAVDGIAGVTISSGAIKEAVADALEQAEGIKPKVTPAQKAVAIKGATIRQEGNKKSKAIGYLKINDEVEVQDSSGSYWHIRMGDIDGYVYGDYLNPQ